MQKNSDKTNSEIEQNISKQTKNSDISRKKKSIAVSNPTLSRNKLPNSRMQLSWKKIRDSTREFLNSQNEIFKNVTTTIQNFEVNEDMLKRKPDSRSMFERDLDHNLNVTRRTSSSFIDKVFPAPEDLQHRSSLFKGGYLDFFFEILFLLFKSIF